MVGAITRSDILAHPLSTIRCFGWLVFFKALAPWEDAGFLALVREAGFWGNLPSTGLRILDRCIDLELRAKRIYKALAKAFAEERRAGPFFAGLVEQERYHAELLRIARAAMMRSGWKASLFNPWQDYLPTLEQHMQAAEAAVSHIDSVDAALELVIRIESSEINQVFDAAIAATEAGFGERLRPFRKAMGAHLSYLVERLPQLSPRLMANVGELRARFPRARN